MIIPRALTSERDSCSGTTEPLWSITIPSILQLRPTAISFAYHTVQKKLDNGQEVGYHFKNRQLCSRRRILGEEGSMTKSPRVCSSRIQACGRLNWMLSLLSLLLLVLCFYVQPAYPQGLPGRLTGTVVDTTAAVVPGANVTLSNEATHALLRTVSGHQGFFVFAAVPAATYTLTIEKAGFTKWQQTG